MGNLPEDFIFSQSSLQDYVDCPRRFQLRYLQRQQWPAPEVDDMLEFERRMEQGQHFHQLVHQHLVGIPAEKLTQRLQDEDVRAWFKTYLQSGLEHTPAKRFPERTLSVQLGAYGLLAKFDLIALDNERALIIDWKTSQKVPAATRMGGRLQTIVYRYVLAKGGDHLNNGQPIRPEQIRMVYWYAAAQGRMLPFDYSAEEYASDELYLLQLVEAIDQRDDFPLTEDEKRCKFCVYRSLCDRGRVAGALDEWDEAEYDESDMLDFEIDLEQIGEIAF